MSTESTNTNDRVIQTNFRFSANILRRLGEELNPSPSRGLVELAKNAYDADALNCAIELRNVEKPGGVITIIDDGDGMDEPHQATITARRGARIRARAS